MKLVIIANPVAGGGRPFRRLQARIHRWPHRDWEVEIHETRGPEHATVIARDVLPGRPDLLAVCGGDGTLKEVATGIPDPPFPVALLPAGTGNVMAHELGLPRDPVAALDLALQSNVKRIDLGVLLARQQSRFLLMAGIGFDAYVVFRLRPAMKARLGIAAFYLEVLPALLQFPCSEFQVETGTESLKATSCIIANARSYGGGLLLTPDADISDGCFDLLAITSRSRLDYFRLLLAARLGREIRFPFVRRLRGTTVSVSGPRGVWVQADGEPIGVLPVQFDLVRGAFPIVVPAVGAGLAAAR